MKHGQKMTTTRRQKAQVSVETRMHVASSRTATLDLDGILRVDLDLRILLSF